METLIVHFNLTCTIPWNSGSSIIIRNWLELYQIYKYISNQSNVSYKLLTNVEKFLHNIQADGSSYMIVPVNHKAHINSSESLLRAFMSTVFRLKLFNIKPVNAIQRRRTTRTSEHFLFSSVRLCEQRSRFVIFTHVLDVASGKVASRRIIWEHGED